jgi:glycosyltransferase involved in cell wall biosynthesis
MVSILLATMGRPEKAQACVQSIKDTAENVEIVVALDGPGAEALRDMGCVVDHCDEPRGSSRAWNDALVEHLGGVIAWDCYRHSFNDREANERAKRAGRYAWCQDAHVLHRHWIFGDRPQDATDARLLGEHPESQRRFDERLSAGFPDDQEPVITC